MLLTFVVSAHPYRRNLPHVFPDGVPIFFTWRLYGSLPASKAISQISPNDTAGMKFRKIDRWLDLAAAGPRWLNDSRVAAMVAVEIERGADEFSRYELLEYSVMPNHVHMLITPREAPSVVMKMLKGVTARRANLILNRTGSPFWQYESFDHWCRSVEEARKIRKYIMQNPVKCGLAQRPQDWPWSSAHRRLQQRQAKLVQRVTAVTRGGDSS
jgi:REP element-mobilizing transposase RayT